LKSQGTRPSFFSINKDELSLSGYALLDICKKVLDKGLLFRFKAKGFSMFPFIRDGDIITISPLNGSSPRIGDVVAFVNSNKQRLVVHRIIKRINSSFIITGDNIPQADGLIPLSDIFGRVVRIERNSRRVILGIGLERYIIVLIERAGMRVGFLPFFRLLRSISRRFTE